MTRKASPTRAAGRAGGGGCFRGPGIHLSDDLVIVEPVDLAGRPVPPAGAGGG
jgi:hypothetical protein